MRRVMNSVSVETNSDGDIVISQQWNDLNERDPEITISTEQAPLVASWILEALKRPRKATLTKREFQSNSGLEAQRLTAKDLQFTTTTLE